MSNNYVVNVKKLNFYIEFHSKNMQNFVSSVYFWLLSNKPLNVTCEAVIKVGHGAHLLF